MVLFPTEILLNIFQHIPIYSQNQCLQVCRSWNAVARAFTTNTTHKVELYGYGGIRRLVRAVGADPTQGLDVRQMYFIMQTGTGDPITQHEFINLMRGCPHLSEIVFVDVNPFYYIRYLCRHNVQLPQLERIGMGNHAPSYMVSHDYVHLAYKYRASLNQICVIITTGDVIHLGLSSVTDYLSRFPCLKCLSIKTSCAVVMDALIRACSQLQVLSLEINSSASFKVMEDEEVDALLPDLNPVSQLETLKINATLLSPQLYRYLKHCCTFLSHLVIKLGSGTTDFNYLIHAFDAFENDQALTITNISFDNYTPQAEQLMQNLGRWFPRLNQVEIKGFDLASVSSNYYNMSFDFNQLDLLYVSIDLSSFFTVKKSPIIRIALEVTTDTAATWYQREGKWKTSKQFTVKNSASFTKNDAREKRMTSGKTSVISIRASSLQNIRLHITSHQNSFNQVIHLRQ